LLALPAGQLADRVSRRLIAAFALVLSIAVVLMLLVVTLSGAHQVWPYFALAAANGVGNAIGWPAFGALTPELVPPDLLAGALALRSVAGQGSVVIGPALGGLLFAWHPALVYAVAAVLFGLALAAVLALRRGKLQAVANEGPPGLESLMAGIRFVLRTRMLLGAISLDLFAVLFGGGVALLPVYAREILHVGPVGLGVLRTAPALGALVSAVLITRRPISWPAGPTLMVAVAIFGVMHIVWGASHWLPLTLAGLFVAGLVDMYSVNIRATTVALVTPNELRGRVNAVDMVFISASNELGAFESGVVARLVGTAASVVAGGALTVGLALSWTKLFPELARMGRLQELKPEPV
jgi:MFS family permease